MKELIREMICETGADLCGFAGIDRFDDAPAGFRPTDVYTNCKTVISFAVVLPKGLAKTEQRLIYGHYNDISCMETDHIAFMAAKKLETSYFCTALPVPCDSPYEYWDSEKTEGRGLLSMRHIALKAGLGALGKSSLLITKRYGTMVTLGAILTDLELPSDALCESNCITGCRKCIDACPTGAIENGIVIPSCV